MVDHATGVTVATVIGMTTVMGMVEDGGEADMAAIVVIVGAGGRGSPLLR